MELDFVDWLSNRLPPHPAVKIGIGDDAALVDLPSKQLVTAVDLLIDGVHFVSAEHSPERIGRKALAVNLSDLAAMAARPAGALVSLAIPREGACSLPPSDLAKRLIEGMLPLAEEFGCPIIGGDTNVGPGPLMLAVTVFGEPTGCGVVRRNGAKQGDAIFVTGSLGGSFVGKHLDFTPRVAEAIRLHEQVDLHAMMDLSDGLSLDLMRLCKASRVGAMIEQDALPIATAAEANVQRALSDGEDFELLFTLAEAEAQKLIDSPPEPIQLTRIGSITDKSDIRLRHTDGTSEPLNATGYQHQ